MDDDVKSALDDLTNQIAAVKEDLDDLKSHAAGGDQLADLTKQIEALQEQVTQLSDKLQPVFQDFDFLKQTMDKVTTYLRTLPGNLASSPPGGPIMAPSFD